jgi:hypothetical protein
MADHDPDDYLFKEIDIIQDIIKRMAQNSFSIKTWTVTLVVATLILKGGQEKIYLAFIPLIIFWFLDSYFLHQERLYRKLYDWVCKNRRNTEDRLFDMNAYRFKHEVQSKLRIMFSITLFPFYGGIGFLVITYALILFMTPEISS